MENYEYIGVSPFNIDFWINLIFVLIISLVLLFIFLLIFKSRTIEVVSVYDINGNIHDEEYIIEDGMPIHNIKDEEK